MCCVHVVMLQMACSRASVGAAAMARIVRCWSRCWSRYRSRRWPRCWARYRPRRAVDRVIGRVVGRVVGVNGRVVGHVVRRLCVYILCTQSKYLLQANLFSICRLGYGA